MHGRTLALYGQSGSGKTTQLGEYAKWTYQRTGKRTRYFAADMGGHDSIDPLIDLGIIEPVYMNEEDDPWTWVGKAVQSAPPEGVGLVCYDSGSSISEALLSSCAKLASQGQQVGSQKALKFSIPKTDLTIGTNTESHYMVVQSYMLDRIWQSTWLARRSGVDVVWTFGEHRAESTNDAPIVGPKLAGKALTASIPKWLRYTLRLVTVAQEGAPARHLLYTTEQPELNGMGMSFANARYPLAATTPLPAIIEPASLIEFWDIMERAQIEAKANLKLEVGI